jgi:hypothetical protein
MPFQLAVAARAKMLAMVQEWLCLYHPDAKEAALSDEGRK